ncbi:ArsA family ATPase, partial [bacterium]
MSAEVKKGALQGLLERKKVLICCGSGGVGKTTTSAALALYAA